MATLCKDPLRMEENQRRFKEDPLRREENQRRFEESQRRSEVVPLSRLNANALFLQMMVKRAAEGNGLCFQTKENRAAEVVKRAAEDMALFLQMMVKRLAEYERRRYWFLVQCGNSLTENGQRRILVLSLSRLYGEKWVAELEKRAAEEEMLGLEVLSLPHLIKEEQKKRDQEEQKKRDQENQRRFKEEQKKRDQEEQKKRDQESSLGRIIESYAVRRIIELQETQKVGGLEKESGRERLHLLNLIAFGRSGDRNGSLNRFVLVLSAPRDSDREGGGSSGCFCGSSGSSGFVPGGSNHDGSSWSPSLRTRPGGTGRADGGSSGCSYGCSRSSGSAPGKERGTDGAGGGSEETPNRHSRSSGNSGFPGSPGMLPTTPGGTGRADALFARAKITTKWVGGWQYCTVTLEVDCQGSFASSAMVSGDGSRWKEVLLLKEYEGRLLVMEARLTCFGREHCCWELDRDTSFVQAINLKSVAQGRTVSISWELCNKEPGRMTDLHCAVEMCQHRRGQDGATETTEPTKFPLTLHARDFSSLNAPAGNNDDSPVYREGISSVGQHERNVAFLVGMVAQLKTVQDEVAQLKTVQDEVAQLKTVQDEVAQLKTVQDEVAQLKTVQDEIVLRVSRLEQQQEIDNRTIAELKNFKEKFSQVQPSSED